jgi:hypothetical protein
MEEKVMEWKLSEARKSQYDNVLRGAQDLETTIGSTQYRVHKLLEMRKDLDKAIKEWWDEVIVEMNLEKDNDYTVSIDGVIKAVPKRQVPKQPESKVGTNANELK